MKRFLIIATALVAYALPGRAQLSVPEGDRTASWYVDHPGALSAVLGACRNDPGHGWKHPDSMNASQANVMLAQREAARHLDATPPTDPNYWRARRWLTWLLDRSDERRLGLVGQSGD